MGVRAGKGRGEAGEGGPAKVGGRGACRRPAERSAARPMPPATKPLAPLDQHKTRALTTIYAPRKLKPRKNRTAQSRMLDELPIKPTLSPFHPLPAIGQKIQDKSKTKVFVLDLNKNDRPSTMETKMKLHDVLKPLTPLRIHGYRKKPLNSMEEKKLQPQQLIRENTYDVIEPVYVNAAKVNDRSRHRGTENESTSDKEESKEQVKVSPKTRFKQAAMQVAKLSSMPETGKLLCLREKQTFNIPQYDGDKTVRLDDLPKCPTQKLTKLSEIFQDLEMKGRHRDKMKKENSWF